MMMAMLLAAQEMPSFDPAVADGVCAAIESAGANSLRPSRAACVTEQRNEYRHFRLLRAHAGAVLAPAAAQCIADWTRDAGVDWNMASYCLVGVIDGKRDYDLYLAAALDRREREAIRACVDESTDEDSRQIDWEMTGVCAIEAHSRED